MSASEGQSPTWADTILAFFSSPYWIPVQRRQEVGNGWASCMQGFGIQLHDYASVKQWSVRIYQFLFSREMPLSADPGEQWPDEALETFRVWVNQGWRETGSDPLSPDERIPLPRPRPVSLRIRRDLRFLTQAELDDYRMRVDECFRVTDASPKAPGQQFFSVHGDWCLHYQEAFLLWHRAYLMAFENRIGCAVPYWNWYAQDAAVEGSPSAGLPQAFKDETYVHPRTGKVLPNPLRFAAAKGGVSKACAGKMPAEMRSASLDCRWVQRDPILYTTGHAHRAERTKKIGLTLLYQQQVQRTLAFKDFSHPQGVGFPWANIQTFDPPPPDSEYIYRDYNFDGAYEQPHDNYHGWVGPDMADNAYTAFDPVFWSYHANIDRIFEIWLRMNQNNATFTANYPLRPFTGTRAEAFEFTDRRRFVYTTIGDIAKDSRALGYDYASPVDPDFGAGQQAATPHALSSTGLKPLAAAVLSEDELLVVFDDVRCTHDSYAIDVFINLAEPSPADVDASNPHYVGRVSRIGMGQPDDKGRCIVQGVPRMLDATAAAKRLGIAPGQPATLTLLITELASGAAVPQETHAALPGFRGRLQWTKHGWHPKRQTTVPAGGPPCCHRVSGPGPGDAPA
jgi:hypothetical protein